MTTLQTQTFSGQGIRFHIFFFWLLHSIFISQYNQRNCAVPIHSYHKYVQLGFFCPYLTFNTYRISPN